ncbi:Cytochrome c [Maioricimonas rarisocia]|uniref:Cytochrome c n=1 Tax=Maioricimonas rarisocia TaxID=2528026 RepID=A0A517ZCY4_9PLAN|nr:family 16 glycoside hydrolase [Maioricimonas rarisocia]QDU40327.1 Cytochrome c [Maioricimonas rarisocia]
MIRALTLICLLSAAGTAAAADDGFVDLFNGKDLSGWKGDSDLWTVEDGTITGRTKGPDHLPHNKFLIWSGGTVGDFELRLKFRLEGNNNSGVMYRAQHLEDAGDWVMGGYQADIHANAPYTGMLYDERGRGIVAQRGQKVTVTAKGEKKASKLDVPVESLDLTEWHEMTVIARGNHLIHKIDGVTTVEIIDEQESEREMEGLIGLQVHRGPAMTVQFKDIQLKKLDGKDAKASTADASQPEWIWLQDGDKPADKVYFRKEIQVRGNVAAARVYATCDNSMTLFIDGEKIFSHGSWESPVFKDVTKLFAKETPGGKHVIAIEAANAGGIAGLLFKLDLESGWRKDWTIQSDDTWQASTKAARGWKTAGFKPKWETAQVVAPLTSAPWNMTPEKLAAASPLREPTATPVDQLKVAKGFKVELLHTVPKDEQGSWVSMCTDPQGRLIVCDQYGGLFRVTPPGINDAEELVIEPINVDIGEAQGLLWAFDSLYVVVNTGGKYESGVYRVTDTDGDDQLDTLETLRKLNGRGEHGPHAILVTPDGESLFVVCGNNTKLTEFETSRVPRVWDEDLLLPRTYGRGFMKGTPAPGGYISRMDPDGKNWELVAVGFRNEYDAALNADGELFSYDADMEWDMNTPWYRPTRVCHTVSGVDFGWRNGAGKWPVYYADTLPPVVNVGPGSPTGVAFGYGAKFPAKYQRALFINDWSYGKLYAVHMTPEGSTYKGTLEEFITGTPLPLTDIVVNPVDGAMYFAIGGRRVQSGLYRVTYAGDESTEPAELTDSEGAEARATRKKLEELHLGDHPDAVDIAWPHLSSDDRFIRYAARVAIEHRPAEEWQDRALEETNPQAALEALLALARVHERAERKENEAYDSLPPNWESADPEIDAELSAVRDSLLAALQRLSWEDLSHDQKLHLLRNYTLAFSRFGRPESTTREQLIERFSPQVPADSPELNSELLALLVYLQAPEAAAKGVELLANAPTQEQQIDFAKTLRHLTNGWNDELRQEYLKWFTRAATFRGGASFGLFVQHIKEDAIAHLSDEEKERFKEILEAQPPSNAPVIAAAPRPFVKDWTMDELIPVVENGLKGRDYNRGRMLFGAANCYACHRFNNEGGAIGPDLTALSGRFSPREILSSIVEPSKVISDQYAAVQILTDDGDVITGRIVNLAGDTFRINTNMLDPNALVGVDRKQIEEMQPSKTSMMPKGLLNSLNEEEILDLMAYLISRGDRNHPVFQKQ